MDYTEHHYLSEDGLQLYYREYGGGDVTVICLPGLTRNSKDFHEIALHLSTGYRVLCPDLRGRGQSDRDPEWKNYNIAIYLSDIRRLLAGANAGPVIFLGTSLGALISMNLAYQGVEGIKAIILNDLGPEIDPVGQARILASAGRGDEVDSWEEAAAQSRTKYSAAFPDMPDEFWAAFARKSYRDDGNGVPVLDIDPKIGDAIRFTMKIVKVLGIFKAFRLLRTIRGVPIDPWDAFRAIRVPCLVLRGETSDILSEAIIDRMQVVKPDLVRVTITRRGHAPFLDEPESLAAIDAFIESLA